MTTVDINSDHLELLPVDKNTPSNNEIHILETLFKNNSSDFNSILQESKDILICGLLFIIFSIPEIDILIKKYFQISQTSNYILIFIKTLLFCFSYFIVKNIYLAKRR